MSPAIGPIDNKPRIDSSFNHSFHPRPTKDVPATPKGSVPAVKTAPKPTPPSKAKTTPKTRDEIFQKATGAELVAYAEKNKLLTFSVQKTATEEVLPAPQKIQKDQAAVLAKVKTDIAYLIDHSQLYRDMLIYGLKSGDKYNIFVGNLNKNPQSPKYRAGLSTIKTNGMFFRGSKTITLDWEMFDGTANDKASFALSLKQQDYRKIIIGHEFSHAVLNTSDGDPENKGGRVKGAEFIEAIIGDQLGIESPKMDFYKHTQYKPSGKLNINFQSFKHYVDIGEPTIPEKK